MKTKIFTGTASKVEKEMNEFYSLHEKFEMHSISVTTWEKEVTAVVNYFGSLKVIEKPKKAEEKE